MSFARNVPNDRALTARMFVTGLLLVVVYGAFIGILYAIFHTLVAIIAIALVFLFAQYWFSDKIALWGMHAKIVTPQEAPELHGAIDRLCALADMPKPRVAVADTDIPNAFATGRSPKAAVVCATTGLLRRLDEPEIEAVLAHELSHVAHRDVAVMTIASTLGVLAGLTTRVMFYAGLFGGGGNDQSGEQLAAVEAIIMLVSIVVYAISFLLTRALSRYRELAADRSGAILIGHPSVLASALVKVTGEMSRIPTRDLRRAEAFNAFFFTPAIAQPGDQGGRGGRGGGGFSLGTLFSTHPPLEQRLAQLAKLEAELGRPR
jgi:heat shock protein HtpX